MSPPLSNQERAEAVVQFCLREGVAELILCAGARNAPLVELIEQLPEKLFRRWSFFEERSAAFFALGRSVRTQKPVAVLTTSGTAAAELLPATIEAFYQGRPLLLITADRPSRYRGSGSPQSMQQLGIFGPHVEKSVDLEEAAVAQMRDLIWSQNQPLHLNVCFEEPQSQRVARDELQRAGLRMADFLPDPNTSTAKPIAKDPALFSQMKDIQPVHHPLLVLGPIKEQHRAAVLQILRRIPGPIYAESLSGLTGEPDFKERLLFSEEVAVAAVKGSQSTGPAGFCDAVIRFGSVPTCRLWRDLETQLAQVPVINFVPREAAWPGLARREKVWTLPTESALEFSVQSLKETAQSHHWNAKKLALFEISKSAQSQFRKLLADFPRSEVALLDQAAHRASDSKNPQRVYVGNSLPVREWDWISKDRHYADIYAHRGVNGIDGQVASFLGWSTENANSRTGSSHSAGIPQPVGGGQGSAPGTATVAVIGDLTAMYDLAALALTPQLPGGRRTLIVVNNGGGMIFKKLFQNDFFLNRHEFSFSAWAEMFGWTYLNVTRSEHLRFAESAEHLLVELRPDAVETEAFNKHWREFIRHEVL